MPTPSGLPSAGLRVLVTAMRAITLVLALLPMVQAPAASAQSYTFTHFAGTDGGRGARDGTGSAARFNEATAVAAGPDGVVYVADTLNHIIRRITPDGVVTTLAGVAGVAGASDGNGAFARFNKPSGIAVTPDGDLVVADYVSHIIRRVTTTGQVTTIAGKANQAGWTDGDIVHARFTGPAGLAVGPDGTIYVADAGNAVIRKVTQDGVTTTLAGVMRVNGAKDGPAAEAQFRYPVAVAVRADGTVYVADMLNHAIRVVSTTGAVMTLAGQMGASGSVDGLAGLARFTSPSGITLAPDGKLYVADRGSYSIRQVTTFGAVTTIAGGREGSEDGPLGVARLSSPYGIASDASGRLVVTEYGTHTVRAITITGTVTTLAGQVAQQGSTDGSATIARFHEPDALALAPDGTLYVADALNRTIRRISRDGQVSTLAGRAKSYGWQDGVGSAARFSAMGGIAVAGDVLYVADTGNHTIRKVTTAGVVTTVAGAPSIPGAADGTGEAARFNRPSGIAVDADGTIYVADELNHTIRRVTASGVVTTLAGGAGVAWFANGAGNVARFDHPLGLVLDRAGMLYVADSYNHAIRKVTPQGDVTTLAGRPFDFGGTENGTGSAARFGYLHGLAIDGNGTIFVADRSNHLVRAVTPGGTVSTLAGLARVAGAASGSGDAARFENPGAIASTPDARLFVADGNHRISVGVPGATTSTLAIVRSGPGSGDVVTVPPGVTCSTNCEQAYTRGSVVTLAATPQAGSVFAGWRGGGCSGSGACVTTLADASSVTAVFIGLISHAYLAEGATSPFFDTRLALLNPGTIDTVATMSFLVSGAAPVVTQVPVAARRRVTVDPKTIPGLEHAEFATTVESSQPLVVDRTMSWDVNGYAAHAETSVAAPALSWFLAEGATHSGFNLFYLLQNPNASEVQVHVRYLLPTRPPLEKTYVLPPTSRTNIWVNQEEFPGLGRALASTDVSASFEALNGQPFIVERALYLDRPGQVFSAGHESAGVTAAAPQWFLAEGATGDYFDLFVLIANPNAVAVDVEASYLLPDGTVIVKPYRVDANSRFNIHVDGEDPRLADTAVSTTVRTISGESIVVERALWWPGTFDQWYEAHNSPGATATGTQWALADGEVGGARDVDTYILVANTSATSGAVRVTLLFEDGTSADRTFTVAPKSRFNVDVRAEFPSAAGTRFGALVESVGNTPADIVVERAMYWDAGGQRWAAGTNALATRLP